VCKATEGTTHVDPTLDRNIGAVKKAGMIPGAYHFIRDGAARPVTSTTGPTASADRTAG
jgi:GH25 family lysozyme M1 (1,4-beta-N-acetylmuramidase)